MNQRCPHPETPACLHLLPWQRNSVVDGFGVAGSQFLYLLLRRIELSWPVFSTRNMVSRQKGLKGARGRVKICAELWSCTVFTCTPCSLAANETVL